MKSSSPNRDGKKKRAPEKKKRETVAEYLRSIESTRKPRPDLDFAAMLMAERGRE
jgi:hypothetical protein